MLSGLHRQAFCASPISIWRRLAHCACDDGADGRADRSASPGTLPTLPPQLLHQVFPLLTRCQVLVAMHV
jgi:hypothetical protein